MFLQSDSSILAQRRAVVIGQPAGQPEDLIGEERFVIKEAADRLEVRPLRRRLEQFNHEARPAAAAEGDHHPLADGKSSGEFSGCVGKDLAGLQGEGDVAVAGHPYILLQRRDI